MSLKIMYFLDEGQGFGGAAHTLLRQAILMKSAGCHVLLSVSNAKRETMADEYYDLCSQSNIEMIRLPFQVSSQPEDIDVISVLRNYPVVRDEIRTSAPDLLHSVQINPIVELVSRELKIPHIMNIYQIREPFFSINYTDIFAHYHICDSHYYANIWKRMLRTDSVCIRTVATQPSQRECKPKRFLPKRIMVTSNQRINYCCVGGIFARKNQLEVIKAFAMALSEGVNGELFLYGYDSGPYAEECKQYLKEKKLEEFIHIVGFCITMEEEYEKNDVLLCGSTCESYPNVISEALAHGLVVISTPVAGVPEVIQDGYNGYLCNGYSKAAIYQKIMEFERGRKSGKVAQIVANGQDTYEKTHSPERVRDELLTYYHHVLEDKRKISEIRVENVQEMFSEFVKRYESKYDVFTHPDMVRLKLWYLFHIKEIVERAAAEGEKEFYLWGAGRLAKTVKAMMEVFFPFLPVEGFIDNHKQGDLFGLPIYNADKILEQKNTIIFVGLTNGQEDVLQILQKHGKVYNQDYFVLTPRIW